MVGAKLDDLRAAVEVARQLVSDWDSFAGAVDSLTREHGDLKVRFERLLGEHQALQALHETIREAHDKKTEALASLRTEHEALLREHESQVRMLQQLRDRYEGLQQDRQYASEELEAILRRLKP
jgi:chromosome segregation ATPase